MQPQIHTLKNGLTVIFIDTKSFPTLTTIIMVGAGSRYENKINNGVAHFFEHMAFKGSKKYPDSLTIATTIEGLGGIFNAFTSKDHTGYWIKATANHFETVVDVLSDMIQHSKLEPAEIEKEKGVIVEEINMYEDMPQAKVGDLFEKLMYDGNSLAYEIAGHANTVTKFNRETFTDYMDDLYHPNNAVVVVAGGLNKTQNYLKIIEDKLGNWKKGKAGSFESLTVKQAQPKIYVRNKKTEQAHFALGFPTFSFFDQKKYPLAVLGTILGGGMSSRLFTEVREKRGLAYYVGTGRQFYSDTGNIVTQAGIAKDINKVKEAIKVTIDEHNKITKGNVGKKELDKAKEMIRGRLLLSMEDSFNVAAYYATKKLLQDSVQTPQEEIKELEKVTAEEVVKAASEIFKPEKLNLAVIGPFEEKDFDGLLK
jgi:predicted Zn-dependent peptidase